MTNFNFQQAVENLYAQALDSVRQEHYKVIRAFGLKPVTTKGSRICICYEGTATIESVNLNLLVFPMAIDTCCIDLQIRHDEDMIAEADWHIGTEDSAEPVIQEIENFIKEFAI